MNYPDQYPGVDPEFIDSLKVIISGMPKGTINYFNDKSQVDGAKGKIARFVSEEKAKYVEIGAETRTLIRLDKIITIMGKPGPAYDAYDRYANVCLTCEDLGQF
ncbi:MAG: hypothetical protein JXR10_00940 [Cyclobacteriaceae bacterium]